MLLYIAGPYRGDIDANITQARQVAIEVWRAGHVALCPHLNTAHFEKDAHLDDEVYLAGDLDMLLRCDGVVLTPDWQKSTGARAEVDFARQHGIPTWTFPQIPSHHPTEKNRPKQSRAFLSTVMRMYRVHLDKNADYSPANILGTGQVGLVTRLWDKVARLMALTGFRVEIAGSSFDAPREPKHESIDDTLLDAANYAIIGLLLREGVWGV